MDEITNVVRGNGIITIKIKTQKGNKIQIFIDDIYGGIIAVEINDSEPVILDIE